MYLSPFVFIASFLLTALAVPVQVEPRPPPHAITVSVPNAKRGSRHHFEEETGVEHDGHGVSRVKEGRSPEATTAPSRLSKRGFFDEIKADLDKFGWCFHDCDSRG